MTTTPTESSPLPGTEEPEHKKSKGFPLRVGIVVVAALVVGGVVYGVSQAAFTDSTTVRGSVATGTVALDNNNGEASTLISIAGLTGDDTVTSCVVVKYEGTIVPAPVRLYGSTLGGVNDLDQYLDLKVETGTGKTYAPGDTGCAGFTVDKTIFPSGTLQTFLSTYPSFGTAGDSPPYKTSLDTQWAAGTGGDTTACNPAPGFCKAFRFTFHVQNVQAAQGKSSAPQFTWQTAPTSAAVPGNTSPPASPTTTS